MTVREMRQWAFSLSYKNEGNFQHTSTFICLFSKPNRILFIIIKYPHSLMQKPGCLNNMILSNLSCCLSVGYSVSLAAVQTEARSAKALAGWFSQLSLHPWKITTPSSFHRLGFFHVCLLKGLFTSTTMGTRGQHRQSVRGCVSKVLL